MPANIASAEQWTCVGLYSW